MLKMYTGVKDEEYRFVDSICEEQYLVGGVTAWVYAYQGPKGNKGSTDNTAPDYSTLGSKITDIGDLIWMENSERSYSVDAISLPFIYEAQDANLDMQIPGLFLFETMDATVPYNLMVKSLGRKIMQGDVIELANLRDADLLDPDDQPINRFYVVHDAFRAAVGYSHTWMNHIYKVRLIPMTDSPEFKDILGTGENPDDLTNFLSTQQKELAIMDAIIGQADSEVPYIHWDNEHIHASMDIPKESEVPSDYSYPSAPANGMYFVKKNKPSLYEWVTDWVVVDVPFCTEYSLPVNPVDGDFSWVPNSACSDFKLIQWDADRSLWRDIIIQYMEELPANSTDNGFIIIKLPNSPMQVFDSLSNAWVTVVNDKASSNLTSNKFNPQDTREQPVPDLNTVQKGKQFPQNPQDGMWFLRNDLQPHTLWKYENTKWRKYNYGGRVQWTGTDAYRASFVNNNETYTDDSGTARPSRQSSNSTLKKE